MLGNINSSIVKTAFQSTENPIISFWAVLPSLRTKGFVGWSICSEANCLRNMLRKAEGTNCRLTGISKPQSLSGAFSSGKNDITCDSSIPPSVVYVTWWHFTSLFIPPGGSGCNKELCGQRCHQAEAKGDTPGLSGHSGLSSVLRGVKHLRGRSRIFWESGTCEHGFATNISFLKHPSFPRIPWSSYSFSERLKWHGIDILFWQGKFKCWLQ